MMVWFVCSANPFYLGLTRVDVYFSMSCFLQILLKYLRNKLPATVWPKRLDFILEMKFDKCLKFLEPLKTFSVWFQHIQSYFHQEIIDEGHEIHCLTHGYGSHGATHVGMYNFQRFGRSPPPPLVYSQFYIVCLQCTLHKATKMLGQKHCQGSYQSLSFGAYKHPSHSKVQGAVVKAQARHQPLDITSSWPLPLCAPLQIDFVQVAFAWHNRNGFTVTKFYNAFI